MDNKNKKYYIGWHHFYMGLAIVVIGFYCLFHTYDWIAVIVTLLGLYIMSDDFYQHWRQNYDIGYHSPLHNFYAGIKKPGWLIWLNRQFDRMFGS